MKRLFAVAFLLIALAGMASAQPPPTSYSLLSLKRLSVAGQMGYRWEGLSTGLTGVSPIPYVRIAPAYALFGTPGKSTGSVAIVFPFAIGLDAENRKDFGVALSWMFFDGSD